MFLYSMLLKNSFLLLTFFTTSNLNSADFATPNILIPEILILEIEMLLEFQNKTNIEMMDST